MVTFFRCGETFSDIFVANCLPSLSVEEFWQWDRCCGASHSAYCYTFLFSVVCLSVICPSHLCTVP